MDAAMSTDAPTEPVPDFSRVEWIGLGVGVALAVGVLAVALHSTGRPATEAVLVALTGCLIAAVSVAVRFYFISKAPVAAQHSSDVADLIDEVVPQLREELRADVANDVRATVRLEVEAEFKAKLVPMVRLLHDQAFGVDISPDEAWRRLTEYADAYKMGEARRAGRDV